MILLATFVAALALRAAILAFLAWASPMDASNLALFYDGHIYMLVSKTLPKVYADPGRVFPHFLADPTYLTGWLPLYPLTVRIASWGLPGTREAALAASQAAAAAAVALFYRVASRHFKDPLPVVILFMFLPPAWLITGTLAFPEPLLLALSLGAYDALSRGRRGWAVALAGLCVLTQKVGLLVPLFLAAPDILRSGKSWRSRAAIWALSLVPAALLQVWLAYLFGDWRANMGVQQRYYGAHPFDWPFYGLVSAFARGGSPFSANQTFHRVAVAASFGVYALILAMALRRRRTEERPLVFWLGAVVVFCSSLSAKAFYNLPRFLLLGAPPACILLALAAGPRLTRARAAALTALALPLTLAVILIDVRDSVRFTVDFWGVPYFQAFLRFVR